MDKQPAIEVIAKLWRATTHAPIPDPMKADVERLLTEIWYEGYIEGKVDGWNARNEENK